MKDKIKISEIFYSIQGEGINAGIPSVFIRFFGCNLQCHFCDTKYAWNPTDTTYQELSTKEVVNKIMQFPLAKNLIFTGGEPALFQTAIRKIFKHLPKNQSFTLELETNGSIEIEDDFWDTINISPKLKNAGNLPYKIHAFDPNLTSKTWWKFVVEDKSDIPEILALQKKLTIPCSRILLMPLAKTKKEIEKNSPQIIEICKKFGFRFCPRLHIFVYSDKKAV
ncbi:7-carboxy-7-deazaguanine synthase QueE [Candidatus Gracilibacteria bacterium]|nr:7-carboxy-7-deazaguanine synthase QueE [Candidatus Gracilibacteria bacterium]